MYILVDSIDSLLVISILHVLNLKVGSGLRGLPWVCVCMCTHGQEKETNPTLSNKY